jgi:hypothetical protein
MANLPGEFLAVLEEVATTLKELECDDPGDVLYRGHGSGEYRLVPGFLRRNLDRDDEKAFYSECLIQGRSILPNDGLSWRMLSVFQHYGIPTRLLDWTDSFAAALFFAIEGNHDQPHVWIVNPFLHNEAYTNAKTDTIVTIGVDSFPEYYDCFLSDVAAEWPSSKKAPIFMEIPWATDRIRAQRGYFTAHCDRNPLDVGFGKWSRKISIPDAAIQGARSFLQLAGVNDYSVYPDLQGLGAYLKKKYGF